MSDYDKIQIIFQNLYHIIIDQSVRWKWETLTCRQRKKIVVSNPLNRPCIQFKLDTC